MDGKIDLLNSILAFTLSTTFALSSALVYRFNPKRNEKELYEDRDGTATEEFRTTYSVRWQNVALTFISISGFASSLAAALVQTSARCLEAWLVFGAWALVALQRVQALRTRQPVTFFRLTGIESLTFLIIAASYTLSLYSIFVLHSQYASVTMKALSCTNLVLSVAGFATAITVPRRPTVFHKGRPIDGQWTVSLFSRYTYSWPSAFLEKTKSGKKLTFGDFPVLDHRSRATDLHDYFNTIVARGGGMLKHIFIVFMPALIEQYIFTIIDSLFMVSPQFAMYQLLRLLEARDAGAVITAQATFWVIGLGVLIVAAAFFNNWMWWISCATLGIPLRAQLSALIFAKAMRRKDVKGVTSSEKPAIAMDNEETANGQPPVILDKENDANANRDLEENIQKTRQGVVNLIGVDTKRVSDFTIVNFIFIGSVCKLTVSFIFLGRLVGWKALLSGIAVQLLFLPINIYFSKKYSNGQEILMKLRDRKLAVLNEALNGIRQIKFAALEQQWQKKILNVREDELKALWNTFMCDTVLVGLWLAGPVVLSAVVILVYALLNGTLPPSIAFTTISLLSQIEGTLSWLPELTTNMLDAYVSLKRISEYLKGPEKGQMLTPGSQITFHNATIAWPSDVPSPEPFSDTSSDRFTLQNLNLTFPLGELSLISGRTGSGKSLLLSSLLGETDLLYGSITMPTPPHPSDRHDSSANKDTWLLPTARAFVAQQPWIENASVKANILFGLPFDESRYCAVLSACALEPDLAVLPDGEDTEIGANGVNLSGGQRWRVSLARALYSRAGILLLDDVFSAVDAHVGRHVYERGIRGPLCRGRTVVLVTHHVGLARSGAAYEVHLGSDGIVEYAGLVKEELNDAVVVENEEEDESGELNMRERAKIIKKISTNKSVTAVRRLSEVNGVASDASRKSSQQNGNPDMVNGGGHAKDGKVRQPRKFVEEEKTASGWIKWRIYKQYLNACGGWPFWVVVCIAFGGFEMMLLGRSWVLKLWTQQHTSFQLQSWFSTTPFYHQTAKRPIYSHQDISSNNNENLKFYLSLYLGFAAAICIEGTLRYLWVFYGSIKASRRLFELLTHAVLRAPLRWLDTMPVGRVLNRFTADFNTTDSTQAYAIGFSLYNIMLLLGIIVAGIIVSPYIILVSVVLLAICTRYALYFIATARETKRLESVAKSPIFEFFSQALGGVSTLRAFDKTESYIATMFDRIDTHARTLYYQWLLNRWLSWRLNVVGAIFAVIVASIVVSIPNMDASLGGFALGFTLQYTEAVMWVLRNLSNVELGMNATERIIEYAEIDTEDEGGMDAPASWPSEGRLVVEDLWVGYAPDLPPVLKGLSFEVQKNERIGVVGRTGAGKSSLTLALFRFLEARQGTIFIDGLNISTIKLHDLRSRLAIIPQDPVLFSGTVRSNLDPFDEHDDGELCDALQRVHLIESSPPTSHTSSPNLFASAESSASTTTSGATTPRAHKNPSLSLNTPISESGLNLSQGQRQLLCLARAIVSRPKIMVLDEATSAVDKATDALIQRSIREEFRDSTLIVIAHRLSTIADFDRLLVLDQGTAVEFDEPRRLLEREGVFKGMVESSGEREALREVILGGGE